MRVASAEPPATKPRIDFVDGLRGVAVGMVVIFHAWYFIPTHIYVATDWRDGQFIRFHNFAEFLASRGYQGVSLFLVLSGFCLSYPALMRRARGESPWFYPADFFARRALRILPPFYAAMALLILLAVLLQHFHAAIGDATLPTSGRNLAAQILLLNNVTPDPWVNGSFWSLGLEWQWYWLFPAILLLAARRTPVVALTLCLSVALSWHWVMHDTFFVTELPQRLFEFVCGIGVAYALVRGIRFPRRLLVAGFTIPLLLAEVPPLLPIGGAALAIEHVGVHQPLYGIAFASLVLLAHDSARLRGMLSWRPLVRVGAISYSVYLIHQPIGEMVETFLPTPLTHSPLIMLPAAAAGVLAGWLFYQAIERVCVNPSVVRAIVPRLRAPFAWTTRLYGRFQEPLCTPESVSEPAAVA